MNSPVCVNCRNEKPVNRTDNRLVTESCGHVKCMDCLLLEKSGCVACLKAKEDKDDREASDQDNNVAGDSVLSLTESKEHKDANGENSDSHLEELSKKKKLETSHIKVESDSDGKWYVCTVCRKKFRARSQVAYHAYCNGQSKPYTCGLCMKSFASQSHYKYHMRVHRGERTYPCDICGQGFFQMSKLRRHTLKHTQRKDFKCGQCSKAFNNATSLNKHKLTHTGERPHACVTCGRRYRDGSNLSKHVMKKHNPTSRACVKCGGERCGGRCVGRRHQCARCPLAFHSSKDLRRHAAVHTDSKPFRCKVCAKNFRRKDNLERHIRNTHPNHAPAAAVECDETELKKISTPTHNGLYETEEKFKLEILNPLPPLPKEIIQTLNEKEIDYKSYIKYANNARQSVIVGNKSAEKPPTSPQCEYVHKIRKANCQNVSLPPIDTKKFAELDIKTNLNTLRSEDPPKHDKMLKKILCEDGEGKDSEPSVEPSPAQVHWRKLKLNSNW